MLIICVISIIMAMVFLFGLKTNFFKGVAVVFLLLGVIEIIVGAVVYKRSDKDRLTQVYAYDMNPQKLKNEELPRIKKVNKTFVFLSYAEIVLGLAGLIVFLIFRNDPTKRFLCGISLGVFVQMIIIFSFDQVAAKRAMVYTKGLESFVTSKN